MKKGEDGSAYAQAVWDLCVHQSSSRKDDEGLTYCIPRLSKRISYTPRRPLHPSHQIWHCISYATKSESITQKHISPALPKKYMKSRSSSPSVPTSPTNRSPSASKYYCFSSATLECNDVNGIQVMWLHSVD